MSEYEEFILQRFSDSEGNLETNKPRECRLCWIRNDYPPFEELEKICNSTLKTIRTYSSRFNWKAIRQKATDLKAKADIEELAKRQRETLTELDALNDKMREDLEGQLDELNKLLENPILSDKERYLLRQEKRDIIKELKGLQSNKLRTVNLPDKINDKQDHKHSGELEVSVRLKKYLDPKNITKTGQ
jgi:hypothetical protein